MRASSRARWIDDPVTFFAAALKGEECPVGHAFDLADLAHLDERAVDVARALLRDQDLRLNLGDGARLLDLSRLRARRVLEHARSRRDAVCAAPQSQDAAAARRRR
jgi:hypothetical protein